MIHLPASVRVYLCHSAVRYAAQLRRAACASQWGHADGRVRRAFIRLSRICDATASKSCIGIGTDSRYGRSGSEEGTYAMPFSSAGEMRREITAQELGALLSGIDLSPGQASKTISAVRAPEPHKYKRIGSIFSLVFG